MKDRTDLSTATWKEVKDNHYDVAILPWGATEPHNLHLPYGTDAILSHAIACCAAEKATLQDVHCMVLPAVPFGSQNPGQTDLLFCLHARYDTQRAILTDVVTSLNRQGIKKLLIINGHGGNNFKNMIRDLALLLPDFMIAVTDWYTVEKAAAYFDVVGDHADELETSVMLHFHPEWVLPLEDAGKGESKSFTIPSLNDKTAWMPRHWNKVTSDTGIGNPKAATAKKGKRFAEAVTDKIAHFLFDLAKTEETDFYK